MMRIVLENLLLFFLPTLAYIAYRLLVATTTGNKGPGINDAPFFWLFAAGAVVVVASLAYFASHSGGRPGEAYAPPVMRDGRIVPGHRIETPAPSVLPERAAPEPAGGGSGASPAPAGSGAAGSQRSNPDG